MATSFTLLKSAFCWVATFLKKMSVPIPLFYRHVWLLKPSHVLCKTFCSLQFLLLGLRRWEVVCSPTLPPPPPTPLFPPFSPLWHVLTTKAGGFGWDFTFLVSVTISHRWPVVHCPFSCSLSLLRSPWQALKCPLSHGAHLLSFRGHSVTSPCQVPPPREEICWGSEAPVSCSLPSSTKMGDPIHILLWPKYPQPKRLIYAPTKMMPTSAQAPSEVSIWPQGTPISPCQVQPWGGTLTPPQPRARPHFCHLSPAPFPHKQWNTFWGFGV